MAGKKHNRVNQIKSPSQGKSIQKKNDPVSKTEPSAPLTRNSANLKFASLQRAIGNQALQQSLLQRQGNSSAGPNLERFTQFRFQTGPVSYIVKLPSSVTVSLPVEIRNAGHITFELIANASGTFSFNVSLDGIPHLRVSAYSGYDVKSGMASAGLRMTTTRQVRRVLNLAEARERIDKAGKKLEDAINNQPKAADNHAEGQSTTNPQSDLERLKTIATAISDLYKTIKELDSRGRDVPVMSFELGGRWSTRPGLLGQSGSQPQENFIGGMFTFHF